MPGIHPASRKQVQWAFASEARGTFGPKPDTPWTSPEAKQKRSLAREWAHRWKCWSWDEKARGKLPKDCKKAVELLDEIRSEHPTWKVPAGVKRKAPKPKVVRLPTRGPVRAPPVPIAARTARLPKSLKKRAELILGADMVAELLRQHHKVKPFKLPKGAKLSDMKFTVHFMRAGKTIAPSRKLTLPLIQRLRDVGVMVVHPHTEFTWSRGRPPGRHEEHEIMPQRPKKRAASPKAKTPAPKRGKTKARRKPATSIDAIIARALAQLR